jgi:hypothetical protein
MSEDDLVKAETDFANKKARILKQLVKYVSKRTSA